ncbi:MAG: glycine--tRNA ligase subunit beta, partial [Acidobacteriota bacterium]
MSGPSTLDFLLEVGTEEIPDRFVARAATDLQRGLAEALEPSGILTPGARWSVWSTPRRLAVAVDGVRPRQEDREEENVGPAVAVAFGPNGAPTRAAEGFARSQGVPVASLARVETPKGEYLAVRRMVEGRPAATILAEACAAVLRRMRFGKMMRWGDVGFRFVRPIRWVVALLEEEVVTLEIAGVRSGRASRGLRGAGGSRSLELGRARDYEDVLREAGVVADPARRRAIIREALAEAAAAAGGRLLEDEGLLEILVYMTEAPSVIHGSFPPEYLELPREVLVTAMRHHQRYFSVVEGAGEEERLLPAFLAVLNREGDPDGRIRRGNEWVLRARLADARFFWEEDRKRPLEGRLEDLGRVIFQEKLGSYRQKTARVAGLVDALGEVLDLSGEALAAARRAAELARCDLTTQIVGEFPELQGVAGGIYARCDGEPAAVHEAVYDLYLPAGAADDLPRG